MTTTNSQDLLPCPFCGGTPKVTYKGNDRTAKRSITVKCPTCRVQRTDSAMRNSFTWLESIAVQQWNQRVVVQP